VADKKPTLNEIAARIRAHLKRFEADPAINGRHPRSGTSAYYLARAYRGGRYVSVSYVTYQGATTLDRERAERYLAWLDAGNVGRHWECEKQEASRG
jgi:hypothetical protein